MKIRITPANKTHDVLSKAFYMAWQKSAVNPFGLGVFQNYPTATEAEVFENVKTHGDYPRSAVLQNLSKSNTPIGG